MAEKKFYVDLELKGNQIKNVRAEMLAAHPSELLEGRFYYNTTDKKLYYCDGAEWVSGGEIASIVSANAGITVSNVDGVVTLTLDETKIHHDNLEGAGSVSHAVIDDHILGTNISGVNTKPTNPHGTDLSTILSESNNAGDRKITGLGDATEATDAVNLQTLQALVNAGVIWQNPVKDIVEVLPDPTSVPSTDRYILSTDNKIYTTDGTTWTGLAPLPSWAVSVLTDTGLPTNAVGKYVYNGTNWVNIQTALERHDQLDNVLGGDYHLSKTEHDALTGAEGVVTADHLHKHDATVRNGMSVIDSYGELGGKLIKNTTIDGDGFNFEVRRAGSIILETVVADQKTSLNIAPSGLEFGTENTNNQTRSYVGFNTTEAALINETGGIETKISVTDSAISVGSDSVDFAGIKYLKDLTSKFTALSLVHKSYVDATINGAIQALTLTASNGLTLTSNVVELGGTVSKDTTVVVASDKKLTIDGATELVASNPVRQNKVSVDETTIEISTKDADDNIEFALKVIAGIPVIGSDNTDFSGLKYDKDYSANFSNLSLVNFGTVKSEFAKRQLNIDSVAIEAGTPHIIANPFNSPNCHISIVDNADGNRVVCYELVSATQITIESNVTFDARISIICMDYVVVPL